MSEVRTIIAFDEGEVAPPGSYAFDVDLTGQSGCDILEQLNWLIKSLKSPYEIRADQQVISPEELERNPTRLTVWTTDCTNADFLMLMHELGVKVFRSVRDGPPQKADPAA